MKKYFSFTRNNKIGVVVLSILIVVLVVVLNVNFHRGVDSITVLDESSLNYFEFEKKDREFADQNRSSKKNNRKERSVLTDFNPNKTDVKGWRRLGFSEKQAISIVKYHKNYGPFEKAEDLRNIYVISYEKYDELRPFMIFEPIVTDSIVIKNQLVEINGATQKELETIKGIGPVFSDRIIKYRNLLGGFFSKSQYTEIYGLKNESLNFLVQSTEIDQNLIDKIKINSDSKSELKKHPYLNKWNLISAILSNRDKSKLKQLDFLVSDGMISEKELENILPYINFD